MRYDRTVIAYHGCDEKVARALLRGKKKFRPSDNNFDWLGSGIYFWEYGVDRALRFAKEQKGRGKIEKPVVIGALLQLGQCFDLMDTRFTSNLAEAFELWKQNIEAAGQQLPINGGGPPDHKLRRLDCAVLNWYLDQSANFGTKFDTVRCGFTEGPPAYPGACIQRESHVQIAVRNPTCILGVFRPI